MTNINTFIIDRENDDFLRNTFPRKQSKLINYLLTNLRNEHTKNPNWVTLTITISREHKQLDQEPTKTVVMETVNSPDLF